MFDNKTTFESSGVVAFYARSRDLQKPEKKILDVVRPRLAGARLLDVGIGGGRTTEHVAPLVREYVGVDYAASMVAECRKRFAGKPWHDALAVADVRAMKEYDDASFDAVWFSYNGIDYIDHEGRIAALAEIHRVARPGAPFFFSTHNTACLPALFAYPKTLNPVRAAEALVKYVRLRTNNDPLADLVARPYAIVSDGSYAFRSATYYIRADAQARQLEDAGFTGVRVFALSTGEELRGDAIAACEDPWLYYLCERAG